jgi:hypothetical protein
VTRRIMLTTDALSSTHQHAFHILDWLGGNLQACNQEPITQFPLSLSSHLQAPTQSQSQDQVAPVVHDVEHGNSVIISLLVDALAINSHVPGAGNGSAAEDDDDAGHGDVNEVENANCEGNTPEVGNKGSATGETHVEHQE